MTPPLSLEIQSHFQSFFELRYGMALSCFGVQSQPSQAKMPVIILCYDVEYVVSIAMIMLLVTLMVLV